MNNNIKMYGDGWCDVLIIVHTSIPSGIVTHKRITERSTLLYKKEGTYFVLRPSSVLCPPAAVLLLCPVDRLTLACPVLCCCCALI